MHGDTNQQVGRSSLEIKYKLVRSGFFFYFQFDCEFCGKLFRTKGAVINHKSQQHRDLRSESSAFL